MPKSELKTKATNFSVDDFIESIEDVQKREDSKTILRMMEKATGAKARMWGTNIIGFGDELLKYESGRELDWFKIGFSPRKQTLTLYVMKAPIEEYGSLFEKLGKHSTSVGCLYIKKLSDIDLKVLEKIIQKSAEQ